MKQTFCYFPNYIPHISCKDNTSLFMMVFLMMSAFPTICFLPLITIVFRRKARTTTSHSSRTMLTFKRNIPTICPVTLRASPCLGLSIRINYRNLIAPFPIPLPRRCRSKIKTISGSKHSLFGISSVRRNRHDCNLINIIGVIPSLEINMPIVSYGKSAHNLRKRSYTHHHKSKSRHQTFHNCHPKSVSGTTSNTKFQNQKRFSQLPFNTNEVYSLYNSYRICIARG